MKLLLKVRSYPNDYYDQLEGDTPFAKAVNEKVREHWVNTGFDYGIEAAAFEVLADFYNGFFTKLPEDEVIQPL